MIYESFPEVGSQLAELKRQLVSAMAGEQRLYQRYIEAGREVDRWRQRAGLALQKGAEDLARAAVERSIKHSGNAAEFHEQYLEQKGYVEGMKVRLLELETEVREGPLATARSLGSERLQRNLAHLERWEDRAREGRARRAALAELDRDELAERLDALEREDHLERQLAELKRKLAADR